MSFITEKHTFCYKVMLFGLKNAEETYQRMVNKLFEKHIERNLEVYVDDMLVKSSRGVELISDLDEIFRIIHKHNVRLNSLKCTFGVASGKFLGFMITHRGIKPSVEKIQAIIDMERPRIVRDIQRQKDPCKNNIKIPSISQGPPRSYQQD